jgi:ketosteroid isomerase-like protein
MRLRHSFFRIENSDKTEGAMTKSEITELATALMAAVKVGDVDTVKALYAPDVILWHTNDRVNMTAEQSVRTLAWIHKHVKGVRYEELRIVALDDGFVQQHVMRADSPVVDMPCMLRAWCKKGRITRIEEYFDSADAAPIIQHIAYVRAQKASKGSEERSVSLETDDVKNPP